MSPGFVYKVPIVSAAEEKDKRQRAVCGKEATQPCLPSNLPAFSFDL